MLVALECFVLATDFPGACSRTSEDPQFRRRFELFESFSSRRDPRFG